MKHKQLDIYDFPGIYTNADTMAKLAKVAGGESLLTKEELNLLPDSDFALIIKEGAATHRHFPIVDKAHAYTSAVMFGETKDRLPVAVRNKVAANITAGLKSEAITDNVVHAEDLITQEKTANLRHDLKSRAALSDNDFALVIKTAGTKRRLYPIDTEELTKQAVHYFCKNAKAMPVDYRFAFAKAVTNKIANAGYSIELPDEVRTYYNNSFNPGIEAAIVARKHLVKEGAARDAYELLRKQYHKASPEKIACLLRELDKETGLDNSKHVKNAYESVFSPKPTVVEKKASAVTIVGDYKFDPNTLRTMPYSHFQDLFSESDYNDLQQAPAENFAALPDIYQQQIAQRLNTPA